MEQDKVEGQIESGDTQVETVKEEVVKKSEVDGLISKALQTREKNIKAELEKKYEQERLLAEGKYKALWETAEAEKQALKASQMAHELKLQTIEKLRETKLDELSFVFEQDTSNIDSRVSLATKINEIIAKRVEATVNEKLKSPSGIKQTVDNRKVLQDEIGLEYITLADLNKK